MSDILDKYSGKTFVFCLPGEYFSGGFLTNILGLHSVLTAKDIRVFVAQTHSSCIHRLRNVCGGGNITEGEFQTPFKSDNIDYDYIMWIDSDIVFNRESFERLLEMDKDVATGWYSQKDGKPAFGFTQKTHCKYTKKSNHTPLYDKNYIYTFTQDEDVSSKTEPYTIDWCGMGWMLIKKGVMEKVRYPWFAPKNVRVSEELVDSLSEDLSFQLALKDAGFNIWLDPNIRVGHEKIRVI
jgi:hypothetical protein